MRFQTSLLVVAVLTDYFLFIKAIVPEKGTNHLRKFAGKTEVASFEDEVEQEVMGLWKRMLQFSVPTAAPTSSAPSPAPTTLAPSPAPTTAAPVVPQGEDCTLELDVICYTRSNGNSIPCDAIPPASSSSDCIKNVAFEYVVSNNCVQANCTAATVTSLTTERDGSTIDITSSFPTQGIAPLSNSSYVENTTLDICTARLVNVTSSVIATTPGTIGIPGFCAADNITTVEVNTRCAVEVQTKCTVDVDGVKKSCDSDSLTPAQDITRCKYDATYTFVVVNTGVVSQEVLKLERNRRESLLDLTPRLNKTVLAPGETAFAEEKNVPIDFCSGLPFLTSADVEAIPVSLGANPPTCTGTNASLFQPIPTCQIGMSVNCTAFLKGVLFTCDQIPTPSSSSDCNISLDYTYKLTNTGVTNNTLTGLERTRNGETDDILALTRRTNLKPGESTKAVEIVNTNFCEQGVVITTATVDATPSVPNAPTCTADSTYEFPIEIGCSIELDLKCYADLRNKFTVPCEDFLPFPDYDICEFPLRFIFTITNSGPVRERVSSLESVILGGVKVDLLDKPFILNPGEVKTIEKETKSDFCKVEAKLFSSAVITANTYPDGEECSSKAQYEFSPPRPPCNVTLDHDVYCTIGDTTCIKYIASLTDLNDPKQCMVDVDFTFSLHNRGLTCLDINNISNIADLINQKPVDITPPNDVSFCPGDELTVTRSENINICQFVGKALNFTVQLNGERPEVCGGFGFLKLLESLQTCSLDLDVSCLTQEGNQCKLPSKIMCDIHNPCFIDFEYTGGMCSMSSNSQPRSFCQDQLLYTSNVPFIPLDNVYIVVTSSSSGSKDSDDVFFSGVVAHGSRFRVGQKGNSGHPSLGDNIHVLIYDVKGGALVQKLKIQSSCSNECPLYTAESFGSLAVVGFGDFHKEVLLPDLNYHFQYKVENVGRGPVALDHITLVATADHIPKDELTIDLSTNKSLILRSNHSFQDTVSFYVPPIHHYELVVSATVSGESIPRFNESKTCEAEAKLTLFPACQKIQCTQCPFAMFFKFTGDSCSTSSNDQSIYCTDKATSIPTKAFIKITSDGFKKTYFAGFVQVGDIIEAKVPKYRYGDVLDDMIVVSVKTYGGVLAQMIKFTTTCLDVHNPLFLGDTFGAVKVLGWQNQKQGVTKDDPRSHYTCV